jgi:hypothetical protein
MSTVNELLPQALRLSERERAELASSLLRSLDPPNEFPDDTGESFERELLERIESVRNGTAKLLDMDEAMAMLYEAHERRVNEGS